MSNDADSFPFLGCNELVEKGNKKGYARHVCKEFGTNCSKAEFKHSKNLLRDSGGNAVHPVKSLIQLIKNSFRNATIRDYFCGTL